MEMIINEKLKPQLFHDDDNRRTPELEQARQEALEEYYR